MIADVTSGKGESPFSGPRLLSFSRCVKILYGRKKNRCKWFAGARWIVDCHRFAITRCTAFITVSNLRAALTRVLGKCALQISLAPKVSTCQFQANIVSRLQRFSLFLHSTGHFYDRQPFQVFECQTLWTEKIWSGMMSSWRVANGGAQSLGYMPCGSRLEYLECSWMFFKWF